MDELIAFRMLTKEFLDAISGRGQRQDPDEEQRRLRRLCELSEQLYLKGSIKKKELSWASMIARKFFLLPPHKSKPGEPVEYLAA